MPRICAAVIVIAIGIVSAAPLWAQDRDGDTIPDAVEERLATDPDFAEELIVIGEDEVGEDSEREQYAPGHDIARVLFGNVARDRYIWCVEFLEDFAASDATFLLYVDADGDESTGRPQGAEGTEYMLHFSGGPGMTTQYSADGEISSGTPPRYVADGKRLYCTYDLPLKQEGGESRFRLFVLSEKKEPHVGVDSVGWLVVRGPGESDREKIMTDDDIVENLNATMTRGPDLFERLRADEQNVHVPMSECELEGFAMVDDEYREWSARRRGSPATIRLEAPKGTYRPGIFVRDESGEEKYGIYVDDERVGLGIAAEDDNRTKLLFLDEPIEFAGGETVEFRAARTAGGYRVESVIFLAEKPEVREREFEISHLEATQIGPPLTPDPTTVRLTWISTWPAQCRVEYGLGEALDQGLEEEAPLANHRVHLRDLEPGQTYSARVIAETPDGKQIETESVQFIAGEQMKRTAPRPELLRAALTVLNATGVKCLDWPVVCGIALPQGALMPDEPARLVDEGGEDREVQTEPAALWPDGSVKWLHATFFVTVGPDGSPRLYLEVGSSLPGRPDDRPMLAGEEDGRITVDTGAVAFELPRDGGTALMSDLVDSQTGDSFGGRLAGVLDGNHQAIVDGSRTELETNGPLRCAVRLGGTFRREDDPEAHLFDWEARITAFRGKPFVRVLFTVGNDRSEEEFTEIESLSLLASQLEDIGMARVAGDAGAEPIAMRPGETLLQHHDDRWTHSSGAEGTRSVGWVTCDGADAPLTVFVRNFWQQYPKALGVEGKSVEIGLLPLLAEDQYAEDSKDPVELVKLYYYMQGGKYKLKQGVTKTHEVYIAVGEPGDELVVEAFQDPLTACADPEWTRSTGAWGDMPVGDSFWATVYDRTMDAGFAAYLQDREKTKAYGALNFGDWWGERKYNWGNMEYDTPHAFFQHFVRTGDIRHLHAAEQAARHHGDVDTVHFHRDANRVGGVYAHCLGHVGGYVPAGFVDGGSPRGGFTVSHTWTEGFHEGYWLTGDRRHLDNALMIADHYCGRYLNNYDWTNCRVPGWHLILAIATYRATADPYYLNACRIITERVIERERPGGGWRRHMVPGHCHDEPRHHGNAGFMVGVLLRGLKDMHLETGDDRLPPIMVRAAVRMVEEMWVPEREGFRYTSCPNTGPGRGMNLTSAEGFGYTATLSEHDPELTAIFERGMVLALRGFGGMGKSLTHATRGTPHALRDLEDLTPTGYRVGPSGEYAFRLRQDREEAFSIQVRRADGEGQAQAALYDAEGNQLAEAAVGADEVSAWIDVPADSAPGTYRLALRAAGNAAWTVGSTCLQDGVEVGGAFTLAAGATELYLRCPREGQGAVRVRPVGGGKGSAAVLVGGADPIQVTWEDASGQWQKLPLPQNAEAAPATLRIDSEAPVEVALEGMPPYLSAGHGHFFVPD